MVKPNKTYWLYAAIIVWLLITLTPLGKWMESSMPVHVLVEIPVLVIIGIIIGEFTKEKFTPMLTLLNHGGITGMILVSILFAFWMIPRWLDASLTIEAISLAKYISLPLGVGIPLAWSWNALHPIARAVVKIEFLSMLFRLGWIYIISPTRLCNNYLINEQEILGKCILVIGILLSMTWLIPLFFVTKKDDDLNTKDIIIQK